MSDIQASSILGSLALVIAFLIFQRRIVEGLRQQRAEGLSLPRRTPCRSRPGAGSIRLVEAGDNAAIEGTGELLVVNGGDARVRLEWAPDVVDAAFEAGWMLDPNGYVAPVAVMINATEDD